MHEELTHVQEILAVNFVAALGRSNINLVYILIYTIDWLCVDMEKFNHESFLILYLNLKKNQLEYLYFLFFYLSAVSGLSHKEKSKDNTFRIYITNL